MTHTHTYSSDFMDNYLNIQDAASYYVATGDPGKVLSLDTLYIFLYMPIPDFPRVHDIPI